MTVLFVTPQEIIRDTPMGGNVDADKYVPLIKDQQEMIIEPILGTKLYQKIMTDMGNDTLAGVYLEIRNRCKPIIRFLVVADFVETSNLNILNSGIQKHSVDSQEVVNQNEVSILSKNMRIKADVYVDRLQKYLCNESPSIPEYRGAQENPYDVKPRVNTNSIGGWYLKDKFKSGDIIEDDLRYE